MDYVPAHGDRNNLADREFVSGARVFDGEDQGNDHHCIIAFVLLAVCECLHLDNFSFRFWKQISHVTVTAGRLDQVASCRKRNDKRESKTTGASTPRVAHPPQ